LKGQIEKGDIKKIRERKRERKVRGTR